MAKPPKKIPRTLPPDSHVTSVEHSNIAHEANTGENVHPAPGTANVPALAESSSANALPAAPEPRPTVTIHHLPPEASQRPSVIVHHLPEVSTLANAAEWVALHFSENQQAAVANTSTRERAQHPVFINAESASRLKLQPDTEEGFRTTSARKPMSKCPAVWSWWAEPRTAGDRLTPGNRPLRVRGLNRFPAQSCGVNRRDATPSSSCDRFSDHRND